MTIFSPIWRKAFTIHDAMKPLFQFEQSRRPLGFLNPLLTLACLALSPITSAVNPPPDGGYPGFNTAEGTRALFSLTTGSANTAVGWFSLFSNAEGSFNTATGVGSLLFNTANENTAFGAAALLFNATGAANTAVGAAALLNNTGGSLNSQNPSGLPLGSFNTASGNRALFSNTTGAANTANGALALFSNVEGSQNTATGYNALSNNTTGNWNTADGGFALLNNTEGDNNTATGFGALSSNATGDANTAVGSGALSDNTTGLGNTANGVNALFSNTEGDFNTATGQGALFSNTTGIGNTAIGHSALLNNTSGQGNIALGDAAGGNLTTGNNNIDIANNGVAGESGTIRIGIGPLHTRTFIAGIRGVTTGINDAINVVIDSAGQLGTMSSSRRFKKEIQPMEKASEAILALKPVTFHYNSDKSNTPQFGLIAEEVADVNPDLVVRDEKGDIYTVRYDAVNAMLLNEFLKEHRKVEEQADTIAALRSTVAQQEKALQSKLVEQEKRIETLASGLAKVSAQVEMSKPASKVAADNP